MSRRTLPARAISNRGNNCDPHALESVALSLLGDPNRKLSRGHKRRWGRNGSFSINLERGVWYSHEEGVGGDAVDLVRWQTGTGYAGAFRWLEDLGLRSKTPFVKPRPKPISDPPFLRDVVALLQAMEREFRRNPASWSTLDQNGYHMRRADFLQETGRVWRAEEGM